NETLVHQSGEAPRGAAPAGEPCVLVLFGASGDLTKRLLMPAFYNLACDGLLPKQFAIVGIAKDELSTEQLRAHMSADIKTLTTRATFDPRVWDEFVGRLHYTPGDFADLAAYQRLAELVARLDAEQQAGGNVLFYLAVPP